MAERLRRVLNQRLCHADQALRLGAEESGALNDAFDVARLCLRKGGGRGILRKQSWSDDVHALVGALRAQNCRDNQLVCIAMIERAVRIRVRGCEPVEYFVCAAAESID